MYTDDFGQKWYKVGLHIHTTLSDGALSPEAAARVYKEAGFDAIALTDHWKYHGPDEIAGLKIISGCEYNLGTTDSVAGVMHIVGVGMKQDPCILPTATRQEIIDGINGAGGLAILAHPAWSLNTTQDAQALTGFGATEIYNTVSDVNQSSRPYSGYFVDLLANHGIAYPLLATDDVHYYDGNDEAKSYIMVAASSLDADAILQAVREGAFYATQGPELYVSREEDRIIVRCSSCTKIMFLSNAVWAPDKILRGEDLTYGEYPLKDFEQWVRVEVVDREGRYGWSNVLWR
ncbi:MAG: CehA/McbA family metallohydrolase [Clostridia bacterium]|nr:CehA/McbA family metallohydrolase [Clostridia bacterium]